MSATLKKLTRILVRKENLLLLSFLTGTIYGVILPIAESDLKSISNGYGGITNLIYFSSNRLNNYFEIYQTDGRALYQFILLTAGLSARVSFFLLACITGLWLKIKTQYLKFLHPFFLPTAFLISSLLELVIILVLMEIYPTQSIILSVSAILFAALKWLCLFGTALSLLLAFAQAKSINLGFRRKAKPLNKPE